MKYYFLDKADHYKEIVNAYYYQGEKTREEERLLQQKQCRCSCNN